MVGVVCQITDLNSIVMGEVMKPQNLLVIMSDEHSIKALGCYGNSFVQTPNIDALAARGTLFEKTYCTSPVCIPARASFSTGLPDALGACGYDCLF